MCSVYYDLLYYSELKNKIFYNRYFYNEVFVIYIAYKNPIKAMRYHEHFCRHLSKYGSK